MGGDGASYDRSLVTAGALETFLESFQEGFITVLAGQDSGHRVGTITTTPSSTNVPSCLAVANHVTSKLNAFTGNIATPFNALSVQSNFEGYNDFVAGITATRTFINEVGLGVRIEDGTGSLKSIRASDFLLADDTSLQTLIEARQPAGDYALNSLVDTKIDQAFADGRYQQLANVPAAQIYSGRTSPGLQCYIQQSSTTSNQFTASFFAHTGPENFHLQAFELAVFWQQSRCQLTFISVGNEAHPWDGVTDALQQPSTSSAQPLPQRRLWQVGSGYTSYSTIAQTAQPDQYYDLPSYRVVFTQSTIDEGTSVWNQPSLPSYEFNKNNGSCFVCTLVFNIIGDWNGTQEVLFQANSRGFVNQGTQNYDSLVLHPTVDDGFNYAFRDQNGDWDQSNRIPIIDVTSDGTDKFDGYYQRGIKLPSTDIKDASISTTTATVTTLAATSLTKGAVNVLNETETDARYATQTALSTYGGNAAINFNASTITLNNQVRFAPLSYTEGIISFLALSVRDTVDSQYYPLFCSDVRYGTNAENRLSTVINDINSSLASKHPLTAVDETAGGTSSSSNLITSGAVFAGNADLQTQIDGKQPAGSYLTAVPANTNANLIADGTVSNTHFQYLSGVTSGIQAQLNSKAPTFSTDSSPTESSTNLVTSGGVYSYVNSVDHVTPIHDGYLSVSGNLACASTLWADGSLRVTGSATFNSAVIAGTGYFQSPDFRHTGTTVSLGLSTGSGALNGIAIGVEAGRWGQSTGGVAIGLRTAMSVQAQDAIAIGTDAGRGNQALNAIALGRQAALTDQRANSIAIGNASGSALGERSVAIGIGAGVNAEADSVALGPYAGGITQESRLKTSQLAVAASVSEAWQATTAKDFNQSA
ncbi:hypothetical protein AB1Y20_020304 [Prymnesium parvum]|uniref:Subtilisin n=1 Tax=Prymnesium parvum TaxID=97485 RepID=A0AB34JX21_PRYPA